MTSLERADSEFVLFVPCDSPFLPLDLREKLSAVKNRGVLAAYASDGEREHPTFCLLSTQLASVLADYLQRGERRMLAFMRQQGAVAVDFSEQRSAFRNMNNLEDLQN